MVVASFVSWDIETARLIPDEGLTDETRLGIACAAALCYPKGDLHLFHGGPDGDRYAEKMTSMQVFYMLEWLARKAREGASLLAWNGASFDFHMMHNELSDGQARAWCKKLAWESVDPFFAMVCSLGYGVGLNAACDGMGVEGKTEGMKGSLAPEMWKGNREEQEKVLEYVAQDVRAQAAVYEALLEHKELRWISRSGRVNIWDAPVRMTGHGYAMWPVDECLTLPRPDTSWMSNPRGPEHYVGWLGERPQIEGVAE